MPNKITQQELQAHNTQIIDQLNVIISFAQRIVAQNDFAGIFEQPKFRSKTGDEFFAEMLTAHKNDHDHISTKIKELINFINVTVQNSEDLEQINKNVMNKSLLSDPRLNALYSRKVNVAAVLFFLGQLASMPIFGRYLDLLKPLNIKAASHGGLFVVVLLFEILLFAVVYSILLNFCMLNARGVDKNAFLARSFVPYKIDHFLPWLELQASTIRELQEQQKKSKPLRFSASSSGSANIGKAAQTSGNAPENISLVLR